MAGFGAPIRGRFCAPADTLADSAAFLAISLMLAVISSAAVATV
jgi:hypothetical protein